MACGNDANPFRPFQGYGGINRIETTANSIYNALQVSVRRTVGASTSVLRTPTVIPSTIRQIARTPTFVDSYDPGRTRASSNFDMRHNLGMSYVYNLPIFPWNRICAHGVGWMASLRHHHNSERDADHHHEWNDFRRQRRRWQRSGSGFVSGPGWQRAAVSPRRSARQERA